MKKKMRAILIALTMIMQPLSAVGATEEFSDLPVMEEKQVSTDEELFGDEAEINEGASVFSDTSQSVLPAFGSEKVIASGDCGVEEDNVKWTLTGNSLEGYTLTIAGTGEMENYIYDYDSLPWREYTENIKTVKIEKGVTNIGGGAFDGCCIESIVIPDSVTSIDDSAFMNCDCLTEITIPYSVTFIDDYAFACCSRLTKIVIPDSVTDFGDWIFDYCYDVVIYASEGSKAKEYAIKNNIKFHYALSGVCGNNGDNVIWTLDGNDTDGYTLIISGEGETHYYLDDYKPWHAYIDKIKKVKVEWGVTCLNSGIFKGCSNLKSIEIADSVSFIKDTSFDEVKNFTIYGYRGSGAEEYAEINNISIIYLDSEQDLVLSGVCGSKGDNVKWSLSGDYSNGYTLTISGTGDMTDFDSSDYSINPAPWNSCHNKIINVKVNRGVSRIGNGAFVDCKRLKDINLPDGLTSIGTAAFGYCTSLEKIEIPDGVIGIEDFSFLGCTSLKKVDIPDSVTHIGQWAFRDCSELESVTLPNKIVVLDDYLFYGCRSLKSIIIPDSVKVIWNCVFGSCSSLTSITIPDSVTEIKAGAFPDCILYVSKGSKAEEYAKEYEYTFRYIESAHTHDWNEGTITKEPSCTEAGEKTYTCTSCGETRTEEIPATGHKEVKDTAVAATCETAGKTEGSHCSVCGQVIKKQEEIPATGHKEVKDTAVAATCETAGKTEGSHCSVCGQVIKKQEEIPAKGHSWSAWKTVTKATVFAPAKQTRTCSVCKKQETRTAGKKLTPTIKLNYTGLILQTRQSTSVVRVSGLANGDSVRSWKSSNTKIVKVDKRGKITAQKTTGKAYITVTLASKKTAKIKVIVQKSAVKTKKLTGLQNKMVLKKGKSITLKPVRYPITSTEKITYATSNKKVVIVNSKGKIKAVAPGKANITVKCGKAKFVIKVGVPRTKTTAISVAKSIKVKKGKSVVLKTKVTPANTDDKTVYASSNKKVATVTSKGVIKGVKKGKAVITVKSGSKSVKCTVTVV